MKQECFFAGDAGLEEILQDFLATSSSALADHRAGTDFIISNQPDNSVLFAPEIDFYCRHTLDDTAGQADTILAMYRSLLDRFDFSKETAVQQVIGNRILIISEQEEDGIKQELAAAGFAVFQLLAADFIKLNGEIGSFSVKAKGGGLEPDITFDQIIWRNVPNKFLYFKGIHNLTADSSQDIISTIAATPGKINIGRKVHYQRGICLYNTSKNAACSKCISTCSFGALYKTENGIGIYHSACTGCGECVSVCPTGALDPTWLPRDSFSQVCSHFAGKAVLVIPENINPGGLELDLPTGLAPLVVKSGLVFDENYLLTLAGNTCKEVIIYGVADDNLLASAANFVNQIYQKKFGRKIIHICHDEAALRQVLAGLGNTDFKVQPPKLPAAGFSKRAETAARLQLLVGNDDLGLISSAGHHLPFGTIVIDPDKCTLCLACADVCPTRALSVHAEDNSLRFTASLCIQCGCCSLTCPETGCLSLVKDGFALEPKSFVPQIMAQDELFTCTECSKEFAPKKAVEKIINAMSSKFGSDPVKLKTLSCCPECKGKLMVEQQILSQQNLDGRP
ncbi:MAG: hypothetical protein CSB24_01925 [Deltaproteobacteria bacterium]|nr:MAG: hypothetical protein CSB24_01925 [Deltaproteobacteria bacterium]